ncbi:MAG: cytochrome c-type biogenesis protein CcmH [Candidatus Krumholzibacteria bacterium]|nr:cytochrome c-type biogenesis protein CcmH [Candidatus Krumholzibacteria bacterium]
MAVGFLNWTMVALLFAAPSSLESAALEREARQIETMLVAPCCWMQQVSEHQSEASEGVKRQIRSLLTAGNTRQQVLDAFVAQYGRRILVVPPDEGFGRWLYIGLLGGFIAGGAGLFRFVRRMSRRQPGADAAPPQTVDSAYAERLEQELRNLD